jgi:tetratricopeptide (TPR) repeat protein
MHTSAEQDERIMNIVSQVRRELPEERESLLRSLCETDSRLYQEIAQTLKWEERMGSFLQQPLIALTTISRLFRPGEVIESRFEIVRVIGEGGMGVVYETVDRKRNLRIAIKSAKPGFQRLLSPELEGALKVRHPNVCLVNQIHVARTEVGEVDFLSMEFLEGETLAAHLVKKGKFVSLAALDIARQLCSGISEAHRSGIVHGDLKSNNVILCHDENGHLRPVITDFGLAVGANQASAALGGTPDYMAPELWQGQKPSKASDIYALGVILYEVVTGRLPFNGKSVESHLKPPAPSTFSKGLDPRWDRVILNCLSDLPDARPADAAQIIAGLEKRPLRGLPVWGSLVVAFASLIVSFRGPLFDSFKPASVRFAVLPVEGTTDFAALADGMVHDVSERVGHLRIANRSVVVIPPTEVSRAGIRSPKEAKQLLHATHVLQSRLQQQGQELVVQGAIIEVSSQAHLREFTRRYPTSNVGNMPAALAGEVSLALGLRGVAPDTISPPATPPYDRGLYMLRAERQSFDKAIALFQNASRLDPSSPLPLASLVEAEVVKFEVTKDHYALEQAQGYLRAAENLNPDSGRVRMASGLLNETSGEYGKALEDYRRAQDLEPHNADALLHIARVYNALDMPEKAVQFFQNAIKLDPAYYMPYEELGEFYFYRGQYPQAAQEFQKTIDRAPGIAYAYTNLGSVLVDLGRYDEAEKALLDSLKLQETARALNSLGVSRAYQQRDVEALAYFERAVTLDPHDFVYMQNLADCNRRLGHIFEAKGGYRKTMGLILKELKENPRMGYQRAFLAYVAARLGDRKRALDEIDQALQLSPGDNKVLRKAVVTYEVLGQRNRALTVLSAATGELLRELDHEPNLADFRQDARFRELVNARNGGN